MVVTSTGGGGSLVPFTTSRKENQQAGAYDLALDMDFDSSDQDERGGFKQPSRGASGTELYRAEHPPGNHGEGDWRGKSGRLIGQGIFTKERRVVLEFIEEMGGGVPVVDDNF